MNKSMVMGTVLGVGIAAMGGAIGGYQYLKEPDHAVVINSLPITKEIKIPREECREETVVRQREAKDKNRIAGKAIGAVIGGALGHQVGGGDGKKVATVAGAVAGGYAGNRVQENMQKNNTYTTVEQVCNTVYDTEEKITGYNVTYRLNDQESTVKMSYDPGRKIPLKDGELVLTEPRASTNL